jgi:hypothetical protein
VRLILGSASPRRHDLLAQLGQWVDELSHVVVTLGLGHQLRRARGAGQEAEAAAAVQFSVGGRGVAVNRGGGSIHGGGVTGMGAGGGQAAPQPAARTSSGERTAPPATPSAWV